MCLFGQNHHFLKVHSPQLLNRSPKRASECDSQRVSVTPGWLWGGPVFGVVCSVEIVPFTGLILLQFTRWNTPRRGFLPLQFVFHGLIEYHLPYREVACKGPSEMLESCLKLLFLIIKLEMRASSQVLVFSHCGKIHVTEVTILTMFRALWHYLRSHCCVTFPATQVQNFLPPS